MEEQYLFVVIDLDSQLLRRGVDAKTLYRTYAKTGFHAIIACSRDWSLRDRMAAFPAEGCVDYSNGTVKLINNDTIIWSDGRGIAIARPVCVVEQHTTPF